jgi:hypothetical protein
VAGGYVGASALGNWFDTTAPSFWVLVWFGVLLLVIWAIFAGLLF